MLAGKPVRRNEPHRRGVIRCALLRRLILELLRPVTLQPEARNITIAQHHRENLVLRPLGQCPPATPVRQFHRRSKPVEFVRRASAHPRAQIPLYPPEARERRLTIAGASRHEMPAAATMPIDKRRLTRGRPGRRVARVSTGHYTGPDPSHTSAEQGGIQRARDDGQPERIGRAGLHLHRSTTLTQSRWASCMPAHRELPAHGEAAGIRQKEGEPDVLR